MIAEAHEMRILGRILTLRDLETAWKQTHVTSKILCGSMGFQMGSKGATTPRFEEDNEDSLKSNDMTPFRSLTMRVAYLSLDRLYVVKEVRRRMHAPTQGDWHRLKR